MKPLLNRGADLEADTILAALRQGRPGWGEGMTPPGLGLPRELVVVAMLLQVRRPGRLDHQLDRAVAAFARARLRTPGALRKGASHARALLEFGRFSAQELEDAAARLDPKAADLISKVEALIRPLDVASAVQARIESLSGARGGRPVRPQLKALSAVISLLDRARSGDGLAATEIHMIRVYLEHRAA